MKARYLALAGCACALATGAVAFADVGSAKADKDQSSAMTVVAMADPGPDHGPDGPPPGGHGFSGARFPGARFADPDGPRHGGPHNGPYGRPPIARLLGEAETAIGVRANQLDAWRDFTDAMQAMMAPPKPPSEDVLAATEPFALPKAMAEDAARRADAAKKVQAAIETLKKTLTPEQLERAARFAPPPPPPGARPHPGEMGPR